MVAPSVILSSSVKSAVAFALKMLGISSAVVAPASCVEHSELHLCPTAVDWLK